MDVKLKLAMGKIPVVPLSEPGDFTRGTWPCEGLLVPMAWAVPCYILFRGVRCLLMWRERRARSSIHCAELPYRHSLFKPEVS